MILKISNFHSMTEVGMYVYNKYHAEVHVDIFVYCSCCINSRSIFEHALCSCIKITKTVI